MADHPTLLGPDGVPLPARITPREAGRALGSGYRAGAPFGNMGGDFDSGGAIDSIGGLGDSPYEGASATNPDLAGWEPFNWSGESALAFTRDRLATRLHDLIRNDGWASAAVTRHIDCVIGSGWRLHALPNAKRLGITDEAAETLALDIENAWREYAEDAQSCDAEQRLDMGGIFALAYRHGLVDGEALSISHWIEGRGDWCTAIQMIDPDRLSNPWLYMDSVVRKGGVDLGRYGEPTGYWFRTAHPGDLGVIGAYPWVWEHLDKKYPNGRWQVVHSYRPNRGGQVRGEPPLAPILRKVRMITKYDNAELQAAVLNALLAAFIQSPNDPDQIAQSMEGGDDLSPLQEHRLGFYEKAGMKLPNVKLHFMYPNDVVNLLQPKHPNPNFETFFRVGLRNIAACVGVTYEQLSGDYSTTNYSSARAALLEVWRGFTARGNNFASIFVRPHYENWLEEAFSNGQVSLPKGAPPFRAAKNAYTNANWVGPPRGYIDPQKEALAAITRVSGRMSTLQAECAEQGLDWREVLQQLAREREEMLKLGLDPDLMVQAALPKALTPATPDAKEPGESSTPSPSRADAES